MAESKLESGVSDDMLESSLESYNIIQRIDAGDNRKHMGILILSPKNKRREDILASKFQNVSRTTTVRL